MSNKIELSVVIPVYFSENTIAPLVEKLLTVLLPLQPALEVVLVNDGSTDGSGEACAEIANKYPQYCVYLELAKNFSEHNAVMAGLNHCRGQAAVIIDDDFQNPPEEIIKLYERFLKGDVDVVYSKYLKKEHHFFRNLGSRFNDKVANTLLQKPKNLYLSSFKLLNRCVIDEVIKYKGPFPYIDGLLLRATQRIDTVVVRHERRSESKSSYSFKKLVALWFNMAVNFSILPLRLSVLMGFVFAFVGFIFALAFGYEKIKDPSLPLGWASLIISVLVLSGIQLIVIGIVGEFLGRLYVGVNGQPQYVVRRSMNWKRQDKEKI